nr:immunoglobulin heavy chain junction region [Mus musculus]
CARGDGNYDYW